jgi:cytoskeletal protein CcmA (bactofilin family)
MFLPFLYVVVIGKTRVKRMHDDAASLACQAGGMDEFVNFSHSFLQKNVTDTNFQTGMHTKRWSCSERVIAVKKLFCRCMPSARYLLARDAPADALWGVHIFVIATFFRRHPMLRSDTLFGKRDSTTPNTPLNSTSSSSLSSGSSSSPSSTGPSSLSSLHKPAPSPGASGHASSSQSGSNEVGSKLIVGPNIKLKGVEITDCDTLVVEGFVEATMDSRVMQIAENGSFKGSAEIDIAEIRGSFDGDLTVRQKLVIHSSGKVSGKIRYGHVVIEEGGQLAGDVQVGALAAAAATQNGKGLSVAKSV